MFDSAGLIPGVLLQNMVGGFGDKPKVPQYKQVRPEEEQAAAVSGNEQNLPAIQRLTGQYNKFSIEQLQSMLNTMMPGYNQMASQVGTNLNAQLKGQLPPDVVNRIQDANAAKAISGGYGGSGMHGARTARDLGLSSLQLTQTAMDSASRWMALNAQMAQPFMLNPSSMFISPQQRIEYTFRNNENQWNRDWLANQVKAMPSPFRQALGDAVGKESQAFIQSVVSTASSMGAGGMGGGMGMGGMMG